MCLTSESLLDILFITAPYGMTKVGVSIHNYLNISYVMAICEPRQAEMGLIVIFSLFYFFTSLKYLIFSVYENIYIPICTTQSFLSYIHVDLTIYFVEINILK